jgi:hypothetical protein
MLLDSDISGIGADSAHLVLSRVAGKDASKQFWKYHNEGILKKYKAQLQIGSLDSKKAVAAPTPAKKEAPRPQAAAPVDVAAAKSDEPLEPYGELVPFADPSWYQGVCSLGKNPSYCPLLKRPR